MDKDKRFFGYLTHDERMDCLALGQVAKHPDGSPLRRIGERARALYVLLGGRAEVRRADGAVLAELSEGDIFGEVSFIDGSAASADVVATGPVTLLTVTHHNVEELFRDRPTVAAALYRSLALVLARRLRQTSLRVQV